METKKNYIELHVDIKTNARWYQELKKKIRNRSWRWISRNFHITAIFMNDDQLKKELVEVFDEILKDRQAPKLTLNSLKAFTTKSGKNHIVHITSSQPEEELTDLVKCLRDKAESVGAIIEQFRLHITLAYIDVHEMKLNEVENILKQISLPSFEMTIRSIDYRYMGADREACLIKHWDLV